MAETIQGCFLCDYAECEYYELFGRMAVYCHFEKKVKPEVFAACENFKKADALQEFASIAIKRASQRANDQEWEAIETGITK